MSSVKQNIERASNLLAASAEKSGRQPSDITLLAVSKRIDVALIAEAIAAGQTCFGENRVQEAVEKIPQLPSNLDWHFIGRLQQNKIRKILNLVSTVHSISSLETALAVDRIAAELGLFPDAYLQVNIAQEASKQGFSPQEAEATIAQIAALPRIQLLGLMTIPPFTADPEDSRHHFANLRNLRDRLEQSQNLNLPGLSMGMSNDFHIAIEEGSTIVRLGTTIFGQRKIS